MTVRTIGVLGPAWTSKILRKNNCNLLMGPVGSDQSRHVDGFGAKKHHFDDFVAKESSFGRLFGEKMKIWASIYGWRFLFIDACLYLYMMHL